MSSGTNQPETPDTVSAPVCGTDGQEITGSIYLVGGQPLCLRHALLRTATLLRSTKIAAVVGTLLFGINQLDNVLGGNHDARLLAKVALTYMVPFAVATFSALAAVRQRKSDH